MAIILAPKQLLEGTAVLILRDHKNLTYVYEATVLTAHQIRWAMLLSYFNYVL